MHALYHAYHPYQACTLRITQKNRSPGVTRAKNWYSIREARQNPRDPVDRASHGGERLILCRFGRTTAALVSVIDLKWLARQELLR